MNPAFPAHVLSGLAGREEEIAPARKMPWRETRFVADWRKMIFVHFSIPADKLAPHVPFPLDLHDGRAFVSLVFFTLENMRPPGTGPFGRLLLRAISDHPFLNVRTYVRPHGRPGIQFLAEWIPNPLSLILGPATYGLPYRRGEFLHHPAGGNGVGHLRVHGDAENANLFLTYPDNPRKSPGACAKGSADEFLLERYAAYTFRKGVKRRFDVKHSPWEARRLDWIRSDLTLVERAFPWFADAEYHSAHLSEGVTDVRMGRPHVFG